MKNKQNIGFIPFLIRSFRLLILSQTAIIESMNKPRLLACLAVVLIFALSSELATARVKVRKRKKAKSRFSPSSEEFTGSKKTFVGSRKAFKAAADEFESSGKDFSSAGSDFQPSTDEFIDVKYRVFNVDRRHRLWGRRYYKSSQKFALSESMGASGGFGPESFAFSPSSDEFEVPKAKKHFGRYFK